MPLNDKRLIEDFLPIQAISEEAKREKSVRKGHISTLHLWWARRPLVACRAAVYGALVPASQFVPENGPDNKKQSLGRANAAKFVTELCKYPGNPIFIEQAQEHILEAHAERLTAELEEAAKTGAWPAWADEFKWPKDRDKVIRADIEAARAPRPRVLDMFAGGGAIPLEALRLGCEAYALDLNPVAHIIELCTLVYPQKYGNPDPNVPGMTGQKGKDGKPTWGGLAEEVRYWGEWVLKKVKNEIGDLYPLIPDPEFKGKRAQAGPNLFGVEAEPENPPGYIVPITCLWTRTISCKNPACKATVPLVRQTWLCKKKDRDIALKMVPDKKTKRVRFEVVEARTDKALGFDPEAGSRGGNATCPFCGTVADSEYVQAEGIAGRVGFQLLAVVCRKARGSGTIFLSADDLPDDLLPPSAVVQRKIQAVIKRSGVSLPQEILNPTRPSPNARGLSAPTRHGMKTFADLFHPRQMLSLLVQCEAVKMTAAEMKTKGIPDEHAKAISAYLAIVVDRMADRGSSMCRWDPGYTKTQSTFGRPALPFVWDFSETNPFGDASGDMAQAMDWVCQVIVEVETIGSVAHLERGSALNLSLGDERIDAVVTDPPYYDNIPYGDLSDFFYVWLKRSIGDLYPEHFSSELTPKKSEATALSSRHSGDMEAASTAYEQMMLSAFKEAGRVLKAGGQLVVVYAHKTTLGWSTLVEALRQAGFTVSEAWPLDTEFGGRLIAMDASALASSIFLVARKRDSDSKGQYETEVRPELEQIVRERVATFWEMNITGADLVIACVGAGLRAFTRFSRVEYANGEEVPAEKFLAEVETVVLESILARLSKEVGANGGKHGLAGIDPSTRFYILWRYTYRWTELDAGEAIVFANGTHVELDGPGSLTYGGRALVEKKKSKYRLRDYVDRGADEKLGLTNDDGTAAPLIDVLHRTLWLMENRPRELPEFLRESGVNREQMRLVAQALAGPALKGGEIADVSPAGELAALAKLTANWRSVAEDAVLTESEKEERRTGQKSLFGKGKL